MSESPPPLEKSFGLYDWSALACLLMLPLERTVIRVFLVANFMFPDVPSVRAATASLMSGVHSGYAYAAIVLGLFALTGLKSGGRVRICWMAGIGLMIALFVFAGVRLPF